MPELKFNAIAGEPQENLDRPIDISFFRNLSDHVPRTITFDDFIDMIESGEHYQLVNQVRACTTKDERQEMKRRLPAVTISGVFSGGHHMNNLVNHSGLMCVDIDTKDNPSLLANFEGIREFLCHDEFSRLVFTSVSGTGIAVVVRIDDDVTMHKTAFNALQVYYQQQYDLVIDNCPDICRLRYVSWDDNLFENKSARLFKRYSLAKTIQPISQEFTQGGGIPQIRVDEIWSAMQSVSPDISYPDWIRVGMALHNEFSGSVQGLSLWDTWSQGSSKYKVDYCRHMWSSLGKNSGTQVKIESLFAMANANGWVTPEAPKLDVSAILKGKEVVGYDDPLAARQTRPDPEVIEDDETPTAKDDNAYPVISAAEWIQIPEEDRDPIVDGVIDAGDMLEVIGPSKTFKTYGVLQLGVAMATGTPFLKWNVQRPRKVLMINLEIQAKWYHRRLNQMIDKMLLGKMIRDKYDISLDAHSEYHELFTKLIDNFKVANLRGVTEEPMRAILTTIRKEKPDVVIIDPLYLITDGDENNAQDMKKTIKQFMAIMHETGAALISVHHDAKGVSGDRDIRDRGAGSNVFARATDSRLCLTPHKDTETLYEEGKGHHICFDLMARNFATGKGFVGRFDGAFHLTEEEYEVDTTRPTKKKVVDVSEFAGQAMDFIKTIAAVNTTDLKALMQEKEALGFSKAQSEKMISHLRRNEPEFMEKHSWTETDHSNSPVWWGGAEEIKKLKGI